ncbi:MAG: 50S ribosomal protein L22, large subunit ribosomal protein L22 [Candidatus Gottesmanbacteria bacterium GW2011_GWA2_43_14]|uniref:Large ribosomal subunit protein uL22 n=1 Tax=Candidatus Gottesmanbacteria bacterium GW2011_GWA2_43_14 TaxID=1618443 RepID=A0A0G1FLW9_9BACT|nr:MAG: 50S ribosomal protein L22, large subunit ribosomal protein L22 [Candidatus Gottesmanbacteria bacterium GW2011_GWA2_43_14]
MEATSYTRYIRISPKKIKSLAKLTVGLPVSAALDRLSLTAGKPGQLLIKAIASAKANAVNNLKLSEKNLVIREVSIEKGPFFKRFQPVARGMAHSYKKRTSHLKIRVAEKEVKEEVKKVSAKGRLSIGQKKRSA